MDGEVIQVAPCFCVLARGINGLQDGAEDLAVGFVQVLRLSFEFSQLLLAEFVEGLDSHLLDDLL